MRFDMITIRDMQEADVDAIVEIEEKNLGVRRPDYWKEEVYRAKKDRHHLASLVAEVDGDVLGFIMGDIGAREFGMPENTGWIHTIGVHPDYQQRGIARALLNEYIKRFKEAGVKKIYTIVDLSDPDLLPFFQKMDFIQGNRVYLERDI
ncbi:MAG: GNAT family N-acetyltransferase [Deltaproteobacteria bacterium]|nr:GNAT family N-acetyltransferase [Deltaproteobacteria bacterium]